MPAPEIPLLRARGSHREVGAQVGAACADAIRQAVAFEGDLPAGRTRAEQLALADRYRLVTAEAYPWFMEELEGAADSAGVDPLAVFACTIEEIWYEPRTHALRGRCSDLVAVPPATAGDRVLVGHNNDLSRSYQESLVAIEWRVEGDPTVLSIGNGIWISAGWNSAGISFTGNELAPNDERVGIPREVQFRSMLRQPTLDMAIGEALRHDRASSYNQVLVDGSGRAVNVEGSATDAELTDPDEHGHLVHTNHYVCEAMLRYEGDPAYAEHSALRYRRAAELLGAQPPGSITAERMREMLSDHEHAPDSLCRHPERFGGESATVFWCVADVTDRRVAFGRGNPCDSVAQEYVFDGR
jgi:isopenicillin-N N-acyltransferase-like protein